MTRIERHGDQMVAAQSSIDLARDMFGPSIAPGLANTSAAASCQTTILKAMQICTDTRIRDFGSCKSAGMRFGLIVDEISMQNQCLGFGTEQPDPRGKIGRACVDKVVSKVESFVQMTFGHPRPVAQGAIEAGDWVVLFRVLPRNSASAPPAPKPPEEPEVRPRGRKRPGRPRKG